MLEGHQCSFWLSICHTSREIPVDCKHQPFTVVSVG